MPDTKITALPAIATVLPTTVLLVVDDPTGTPTNKKATVSQLPSVAPAAHHVTHETGGVDALAALSAAILTSGTLPDARLSTNVQMKPVAQSDVTGLPASLSTLTASASNAQSTANSALAKANAHATNHNAAGSDPVLLTTLAGFPGGTATFLRADGQFATQTPGAHHATHEPGGTDVIANNAWTNYGNVFTNGLQTISDTSPQLQLNDSSQPADKRLFRVVNNGQLLYLQALSDAGLNIANVTINRSGALSTSGAIFPGRIDTNVSQVSWYLASHPSYGLYSNTGLYLGGLLSATGFGGHNLSAAGAGGLELFLRNLTDGAGNFTRFNVGNDASLNLCELVAAATSCTFGGDLPASGVTLRARGAGGLILNVIPAAPMRFWTTNVERMKITPTGEVVIGPLNANVANPTRYKFQMAGDFTGSNFVHSIYQNLSSTGVNGTFLQFCDIFGSPLGTISQVGQGIQYSSQSDERLKTDLGRATDLTALRSLVIHDFLWTQTQTRDRGLFAQQAHAHFPRAITPGTDERTPTGHLAHPWMTDYSKFVPDLIAGWQQHDAEIAALITELTELRQRMS